VNSSLDDRGHRDVDGEALGGVDDTMPVAVAVAALRLHLAWDRRVDVQLEYVLLGSHRRKRNEYVDGPRVLRKRPDMRFVGERKTPALVSKGRRKQHAEDERRSQGKEANASRRNPESNQM